MMDQTTASPKSSCCSHLPPTPSGNPQGTIISISGIDTYISLPPSLSLSSLYAPHARAILFLTEGHGILLPHAQLLADRVAEELSCPVLAPELHGGNGFALVKPPELDADKEMVDFLARFHPGTVDPILEKTVAFMETRMKVERWGGIGYCFGARYVLRLMTKGAIVVGVLNHPSFFTMEEVEEFGRAQDVATFGVGKGNEIVATKPPLAIFAAETDSIFPEEKRRETEDRLKKAGATWMCTTFSGVDHGFSIRPDLTSKAGVIAWQGAFKGAITWFDQYLQR